jgi:hypothetical protein
MKHYKVYITTTDRENDEYGERDNVWIEIYAEGKYTLDAIEHAETQLQRCLGKSLNEFPGFNIFFKWED